MPRIKTTNTVHLNIPKDLHAVLSRFCENIDTPMATTISRFLVESQPYFVKLNEAYEAVKLNNDIAPLSAFITEFKDTVNSSFKIEKGDQNGPLSQ